LKLVITNVIGGLGNQMFQYAAGRAISLSREVPLRLDITGFANYELHQGFELQRIFDCASVIASKADVRTILGWQSSPSIQRLLLRSGLTAFRHEEFVVEPHFHYWTGIKNVPSDCYLVGYWQSEKYFCEITAQIRKDFAFVQPMESQNTELAQLITSVNAVSLHVRRGDYANNPATTSVHGLCPLDFYRAAIRYVSERVAQPHFFIFSDDISWVQENLKIDFPHQHVKHNLGAASYNDMRLMSMCKHHIIANSSFSWWGAWLNPHPDKLVIAPKQWFANKNDVRDLIPQGWAGM
jgi:hypothetical protein